MRRAALILSLLASALSAQQPMPIAHSSTRTPPAMAPLHQGKFVSMTGVLASPVVKLRTYSHASLQDEQGNGVTLESTHNELASFARGDRLEISGVISHRGGLPVLVPKSIRKTGSAAPPSPQPFDVDALTRFENLGRYISVEAQVLTSGDNAGGDLILLGDSESSVYAFLPREQRTPESSFRNYRPGDRVRVVGLSSQYCPLEPHDRHFQVLVGAESAVSLVSRGWPFSPNLFLYLLLGVSVAGLLWWKRERRLTLRRRVLHSVMSLSEDVISASSPREIVRRLQCDLPRAIGADDVEVFLHNRPANMLDRIAADGSPQSLSIPVEEPIGSFYSTVALCFRNRALLHVPDTRRSPIVTGREKQVPASAVFVPMHAQRELLGVLAAYHRKPSGRPSTESHTALQHLANQVAASLKLQEQQHMREQLLRSEKMAAAGQLISAVANDLRTPLESISRAARQLMARTAEPELREIETDAERGLEIVSHLVSFARMERSEAKPLDIHVLVNNLLDMRQQDRERKGVLCENSIPISKLEILADQAQIEQAALTLLVHAEHAASMATDRTMRVSSRVVGKKVQVAIESSLVNATDPFAELGQGDYFGLPVAQAIAQSHGGDIRYTPGRSGFRLEFELPLHSAPPSPEKPAGTPVRPVRVLTALIVEPDTVSQRKLLAMLAARGHRAIPTVTAEEAADLVQRMTFDVVFCAVRLHGLSWVELFQRVRRRVGAFALMTDGYDSESARAFKGGEGQIVPKPIEDADLDNFLALIELRHAAARR